MRSTALFKVLNTLVVTIAATIISLAFSAVIPQGAFAEELGAAAWTEESSLIAQKSDGDDGDYYVAYEMNTTFESSIRHWQDHCISFTLPKRMHVSVSLNCNCSRYLSLDFEDRNGNILSGDSNTKAVKNSQNTWDYTYGHSCNLDAGSYYLRINYTNWDNTVNWYEMTMTSEDLITLDRTSITSLTSPSGGVIKTQVTPVGGAVGYECKFATNPSLTDAVTYESASPTFTKSGLKKGVYYYVTVRPFAVYSDGVIVYGSWSRVQSVYVKKLTNKVMISTSTKTLKQNSLRKSNRSFNVIADDKANAKLTYVFTSIPSKAKKHITIAKKTGKVTVKKGLKKGTYKPTVKVTAKATSSYYKASATKRIVVKIK